MAVDSNLGAVVPGNEGGITPSMGVCTRRYEGIFGKLLALGRMDP